MLLHLIDLSEKNLFDNYQKIRNELKNYDLSLYKKRDNYF